MLDIQCVDCVFQGVFSDRWKRGEGYDTNDWHGVFANELIFAFDVGDIIITVESEVEYCFDEGEMMMFMAKHIEDIKTRTFEQICVYLKEYFKEKYDPVLWFKVRLEQAQFSKQQ